MAPMHTPAPTRDSALAGTMTIDAYARQHQLTPREVRQQMGSGLLQFVQIRGQIRVQLKPESPGNETASPDSSPSTE
ncbi:hypothetical protein NG895_06715 [Aeoliella sp. ICT_H6.2]|uniref:Uncharacterized protein n=1 Tax=Aeoliella straminimaris TaxID=2954799 RepID=A0A9X2FC36_9BACT|nr:hypothetical protein [Aeoliella straminimaris]MCO6043594.1 hypothetical protein [Aeoliella straminimaris]